MIARSEELVVVYWNKYHKAAARGDLLGAYGYLGNCLRQLEVAGIGGLAVDGDIITQALVMDRMALVADALRRPPGCCGEETPRW
jgi:hypothetical protein